MAEKDTLIEISKSLKANYKAKSRKLKDVVIVYQKRYHDIDIKFMHEEINRLGQLKDYAKSTIHELENQSKLQ